MVYDKWARYRALLLRLSMGVPFVLHGLVPKVIMFGMAGSSKR